MPNVFCSISIECWCVSVSTRWSMLTSNCVVPRSFLGHEKQFWTYPYQKYHTPLTFVKPLWTNTGYAIRNVASWVHEFLPSFSTTWRSGQVSLARSPELPKGHDNKGGSFYACFLAWGKTIYGNMQYLVERKAVWNFRHPVNRILSPAPQLAQDSPSWPACEDQMRGQNFHTASNNNNTKQMCFTLAENWIWFKLKPMKPIFGKLQVASVPIFANHLTANGPFSHLVEPPLSIFSPQYLNISR